MNKLFFTALALLGTCTAVAAEDYKGETPKSGGTYCLYNVGKKQFLGTEDGRLVLGGEKVKVTLEQIESATTPGFYRIMSGDTAWGAELWGTPSAKGGTFSEWRIEPVEGSTEEYAISSRNTEAAQWLLVDANTPETAIEGVKTDGVETEQKQTHAKGVHNIGGQQVRTDSNTDGLQEGIYIVNGKKTLLKK